MRKAIFSIFLFILNIRLSICLQPLTIKGNRFIQNGKTFNIIGVDYQPGGSSAYNSQSGTDALSDADACLRDAYALQQLGANSIRIYTLNPDINHDECMTIFYNAGIYVFLDVNSGAYSESLNRYDPQSSYNFNYLKRVFKFIEAFKGYPNVAGFFSGNEIINDGNSAKNDGPYIRAVQRDMRQYIVKHATRPIPVGYSAADDIALRLSTFKYLQCNVDGDTNDDSKAEFFGLNSYQWCSGISNWDSSGYGSLESSFSESSIPLMLSEYGCNTVSPRTFEEVPGGVYSGLSDTFSGGLIYEYSQEPSNYGLVQINEDNSIRYLQDFDNLKKQFAKISSSPAASTNSITKCNSNEITSAYSDFGASFNLPKQPSEISQMISNGVGSSNNGKLLHGYDRTSSKYAIYDVSGASVNNASINVRSSANTPEGSSSDTTSESSSSRSASSGSSSSSKTDTASSKSSKSHSTKGSTATSVSSKLKETSSSSITSARSSASSGRMSRSSVSSPSSTDENTNTDPTSSTEDHITSTSTSSEHHGASHSHNDGKSSRSKAEGAVVGSGLFAVVIVFFCHLGWM